MEAAPGRGRSFCIAFYTRRWRKSSSLFSGKGMLQQQGRPPLFFSAPVFVNSKVSYTAVSTTVFSVEQAIDVLDAIGAQEDSEDCLPFAVTLVENGELISIAEDNGEFGAGELLADALNGLDGFNALVCCTRKVRGCYVSEIVQPQKLRCIREAAVRSLEVLYEHLRPRGPTNYDSSAAAEIRAERHRTLITKKISLAPPKMTYEEEQALGNPVLHKDGRTIGKSKGVIGRIK